MWLQVGGFCMMHKDDLKRVAPLWLQFSKAVRHDPDVRRPHSAHLSAIPSLCRRVSSSWIACVGDAGWQLLRRRSVLQIGYVVNNVPAE